MVRNAALVSWMLVAALLGATPALVGCGGASPAPRVERGVVALQCEVSDAEIWVDGRYFREVAELTSAFRLRPGEHRIEVRHPAYHSMYYELTVEPGSRHTLKVELARRLP